MSPPPLFSRHAAIFPAGSAVKQHCQICGCSPIHWIEIALGNRDVVGYCPHFWQLLNKECGGGCPILCFPHGNRPPRSTRKSGPSNIWYWQLDCNRQSYIATSLLHTGRAVPSCRGLGAWQPLQLPFAISLSGPMLLQAVKLHLLCG